MTADVNRLSTLNLFEDLKQTNIKHEELKKIVASYQKLASTYIKNNQVDLFKDLVKQKDVIFSYLPSLNNASIKKVAKLQKTLEAEMGNIDEIDTLSAPNKEVQFVKVAYNNGKWTICAHNLDDIEFTKKETPEAINCLVDLVGRLDEQEAAYALCHAKTAGLFTMAALPYVRTQDFTNTALEQKYSKDPGTVLGPIEHSWESSTDNTNMPVSRQIASVEDEFREMDTFKDEDGDEITISSISGDAVITFDNSIYTKEEVEENIKNGHWTKVEADKKDMKVQKLIKEAESLIKAYEPKLVSDEAATRIANEALLKIEQIKKEKDDQYSEVIASVEPRLRKIAAKIDSITFEDKESVQKLQKLKVAVENLTLNYSRPVDEYQRRTVNVEQVENVLDQMRAYVSPKNLKAFDELSEQLFTFNSRAESFSVSLTNKDPRNEELIQEEMKKIRKQIKTSQNELFVKDAAYNELDKMLIAGQINFEEYNTLSDFAEMNSQMVLDSVKNIQASLNKQVQADVISNITEKIVDLFNSAKDWIMDKVSFLSLQEKQAIDFNEELDETLKELNEII